LKNKNLLLEIDKKDKAIDFFELDRKNGEVNLTNINNQLTE
jgi:hypothetical protein